MERIGLSLGGPTGNNDAHLIALAQRADELGYDTLWTGESWGRDVFTILTMVACHTHRIRVGTGIATIFSRTPALTAQSIASLDVVSQGRAVLGLGTSGRIVVEEWHGVKYDKPLERTREYVDIIRTILSGERLDHRGEFFTLGRFRLPFSPVQARIPIYIASLGPRNLALTGEVADGWLPTNVHLDHLPEMKDQVKVAASKAGRKMEDITVAPFVLACATRRAAEGAEAKGLLRSHLAYYIGGMGFYYSRLFSRYGYVEETRLIREAWAKNQRGEAASMVTEEMLDKVTILGDAEECRGQLERYRASGADMPVIVFPHRSSPEAQLYTLEALAPKA